MTLALIALTLVGCAQQPSYQVVNAPVARTGAGESVRESVEQKNPSGLGMIAGGLIGGGLGSLVGGSGRTAATILGAVGGGYVGHNLEQSETQVVCEISLKYDNDTLGTVRQTSSPPFRIGDRVLVTDRGLEPLR
ncbi:MAG TPA: glycine zipper 2TM domain-containing protein [Casimicrobiaceae bacterium]